MYIVNIHVFYYIQFSLYKLSYCIKTSSQFMELLSCSDCVVFIVNQYNVFILWINTYHETWCVTANTFKVKENLFLCRPWRRTEGFGELLYSPSFSVVDVGGWWVSGPGCFIRAKESPGSYEKQTDELKGRTGRFGKEESVLRPLEQWKTTPLRPFLVPTVSYWLLRLCKARAVINECLQCCICLVTKFSITDMCWGELSRS